MKKIFSLLAAVLMAGSMMAETTSVFSWDGDGQTAAITPEGGSVAAQGGDANVVAGIKQKNNWCFKLGKTYMVESVPTHYVEITLTSPLQGGESIEIGAFVADATKNAILGINFDGDNELTESSEDGAVNRLTANGVPTSFTKTVPAAAAGATTIRLYRQSGGTSAYVSKFVITREDAPAAMDTVYFVNAANWEEVKIHAWGGTAAGTTWPGLDVEKADYQLQGKDVYFFVAEAGAYGKCIFNNNNGTQTADLDWTSGKYYYNGSWMTREELEAPVVVDMYLKHNWAGAGNWTWKQLTYNAETETYTLRDIYGGTGCNWNTSASDNGATWVATPTLVGEPAVGDSAVFTLAGGAITITKIMGEVGPEPVITKDTVMYIAGNITNWAEGMQVLPYTITLPADSTIEFKQVRVITTYTDEVETAKDTTWFGQKTENYVMTRESMTEAGWVLDGTYNVVLTADAEGDYVFAMNGAALLVTFPEKKQQETTINYYLAGTMTTPAWGSVAMPGDSIVLNLAAGEHGFKVQTGEGNWDGALGYDNVNADCSSEGIYTNGDRNVMFTLAEAGEVVIRVVEGQICVTGAFQVPEVTNYYLAGSMNGWSSTAMAGDSIVLNLEAGDYEFKVQLVAGYWDNALGYSAVDTGCSSTGITEGENGNVAFTLAQDGEVKIKVVEGQICVTLPAAGPTTIINNAEAVKAVKMIENGQLVIIREGKRYNALGAQF